MITELAGVVSFVFAIVNGITVVFLYRQYRDLADASVEFAALVITTIEEQKDGEIRVDPLNLAGVAMDHLSRMSGMVQWFKG